MQSYNFSFTSIPKGDDSSKKQEQEDLPLLEVFAEMGIWDRS